jgi:hypothetical protein
LSEATLRQAVEAQARARVDGDATGFSSFCTPQALASFRAMPGSRPRGFDVLALVASGATGSSDVLYRGRGTHVLAQRWQVLDGVWTTVDIKRLAAPRQSLWQRISAMLGGQRTRTTEDGDEDEAA